MRLTGLLLAGLLLASILPAQTPDCGLVPGWSQKGPAREYTTDNLYDYMDGGSEGYFIYDFVRMKGITCEGGGGNFTIDVSEMAAPDMAWGIFISNFDPREPTEKIATIGQVTSKRATFAKDKYFVEIAANSSGDHSEAMRAFLLAMEKQISGTTATPKELAWFPDGYDMVRMIPQSVLGMRALPRGFTAEYSYGKAFVVLNPSAEEAAAALQQVRERLGETTPANLADEAFRANDRYLGNVFFVRKGSLIAGYTDIGADQDAAALASALAGKLP